jgi:photosystem II stability/assembly factor-like uncharacterized protein
MKQIFSVTLCLYLLSCQTYTQEVIVQKIEWKKVNTGFDVSLRGVAAVSKNICWVSGSQGKVLLTLDGGQTWLDRSVPDADTLQFRDIEAFNKDTVLVMASGFPGLIFKTLDGGLSWTKVYENYTPGVFFDAMDFWDDKKGMAFSDAPKDKLIIIQTNNGGDSWHKLPDSILPQLHYQQGGFAASGSCLNTFGSSSVSICLGGIESTFLLSSDFGKHWQKIATPLDFGEPSKGIFSIDFLNESTGYIVGGDYRSDSLSSNTIAKTEDGGLSWELITDSIVAHQYRSAVLVRDDQNLICTSRTGSNVSMDNGKSWQKLKGKYYSLSQGIDKTIWGSGPNGTVGKVVWP